MASFPVKSTFLYDMRDLAQQIESRFAQCLLPATKGIYVLGREKPVMIPTQQYFRRETDKTTGQSVSVLVCGIHDIKGDIFNIDAELVLSSRIKPQYLSETPQVPVIGMKIIEICMNRLVMSKSAFSRGTTPSLKDILEPFLLPEMYAFNNQALLDDVCEALDTMMLDLKTDIRQFLGADDWIMHFVKTRNHDLVVEKTIDFRIHDWMRRTASGDWR